jgi:hypothetical protein
MLLSMPLAYTKKTSTLQQAHINREQEALDTDNASNVLKNKTLQQRKLLFSKEEDN